MRGFIVEYDAQRQYGGGGGSSSLSSLDVAEVLMCDLGECHGHIEMWDNR